MYIKNFEYLAPTINKGDHIEVEGVSREGYACKEFLELVTPPVLTKTTAVLYAGGFNIHQSESRDGTKVSSHFSGSIPYQKSSMVIKESTMFGLHQWIGAMEHNELVVYASINSNTCASSMFCLYEAERLLNEGVCDEVIIIAEERTSFNTLRIFKEHRIPIVCGDAFAMVTLTNTPTSSEVVNTKWAYKYDRNPFRTTVEGYKQVDTDTTVDNVKPHGTRTDSNNTAEATIIENRNTLYYKDTTGHTQGASALLELCLLLDDENVKGSTLCIASGLGGFYGSCTLQKH